MQEALQKVKKDLGAEAIILSTRQVRGGGGTFGLFGKPMLEVTAARDADGEGEAAESMIAALPKSLGRKAKGGENGALQSILARQRAEAQSLLSPLQDEIQDLKSVLRASGDQQRAAVREEMAITQIRADMGEMRQMMHLLAAQSAGLRDANYPENLVVLYQQLTFNGLEDKFARRLIEEANKTIAPKELEDFSYVKIFLARMLMKIVKVTGAFRSEAGRQRVCALVGPTGVGKTTTVAKLASEQLLKHHRQVALITVDTFRIAAVEQLKIYAKIMGVPITVVTGKQELQQAIQSCADKDVVLIDTGGRSQRDDMQMSELYQLFGGESPIETYLTLSATTKDSDLTEVTRRFGEVPLAGVLFTKLDESTTFGSLINHSIRFKLPTAYLATGQKVPEDLEVATKERLVDLLLNISAA
jgi:flagellar biosynthesis protein FlhF